MAGKESRSAGDLFQSKIAERLLEARTILIVGEITSKLAQQVTAQLLAMASDSDDDITIFLHSEGGHVESGDTLHDMIRFVKPRVKMVGTGWVASAGAHIYLAVPREDRFCLPNTRFLIHQPQGGMGGQAADIRIEAEEMHEDTRAPEPDPRRRHGSAPREGAGGHGAEPLDVAGGGPRVRNRRDHHLQRRGTLSGNA